MRKTSKLAGGLVVAAMLVTSAAPASARGYYGHGRPYHHDRGGSDAGAVIGTILGVGILAAIAASAVKQNADKRRSEDRGYDPRDDDRSDQRADEGPYDPRYEGGEYDDRYGGYDSGRAEGDSYAGEDAAVDACALAAREQASRNGGFAEVRDVTDVRPFGNGWDVTGTVSQRAGWRAPESRLRSFRCIWGNGRVEGVTFN